MHTAPYFSIRFIGKAYIISTKASIPPPARQVAVTLGFQPVQVAAVTPYHEIYESKQAFCQACFYTDPPGERVITVP